MHGPILKKNVSKKKIDKGGIEPSNFNLTRSNEAELRVIQNGRCQNKSLFILIKFKATFRTFSKL